MARPHLRIPAFSLPFVTRSLRGGRGRRFVLLSLLFAFLSTFVGGWLALGSGSLEREFRTGVDLERERWERERQEFTIISDSRAEYEALLEAREEALVAGFQANPPVAWDEQGDYRVRSTVDEARSYLVQAAHANAGTVAHRQLRERARTLLGAGYVPSSDGTGSMENAWYFDFADAYSVERLESILAADGIPAVELYRSPLGPREALMLVGVIAGGLLSLLLLVLAPLLVGVQQAQEVHENTLMPLTGTSMSPRQLALGLASGPWAIVAIFAAPQVLLLLLMAIVVGHVDAALAMIASTAATGLLFTFGAQLVGQFAGRQRTPGIVGIGLLFAMGAAWIVGTVVGLNLDDSREMVPMLSMLPQASSLHFLRTAFVPAALDGATACDAVLAASIGAIGSLILAYIALAALAAKMGGNLAPLLGRGAALVAALTCAVMVMLGLPFPEAASYAVEESAAMYYFGSLAILALPLALLMMARVPAGDIPAKLRRVPVLRLLGELWAFVGLHFVLCVPIVGSLVIATHPVALLYLAWSISVLGLLAIRMAAVPARVLGVVWALFCAVALVVGYCHAIAWTVESNVDATDLFALANLSPLLGVVQAALTVWVPWSLLRTLKGKLAGVDAKAA